MQCNYWAYDRGTKMKKIFIFSIVIFLFAGCENYYLPSADKARETASAFMTKYYVDMEFDAATELGSGTFQQSVNTAAMVKDMTLFYKKYGKMQGFNAEAYLLENNGKTCVIFYKAICENEMIYNKIVLSGDAKIGYKVEAAFAQDTPFKEYKDPVKFKGE